MNRLSAAARELAAATMALVAELAKTQRLDWADATQARVFAALDRVLGLLAAEPPARPFAPADVGAVVEAFLELRRPDETFSEWLRVHPERKDPSDRAESFGAFVGRQIGRAAIAAAEEAERAAAAAPPAGLAENPPSKPAPQVPENTGGTSAQTEVPKNDPFPAVAAELGCPSSRPASPPPPSAPEVWGICDLDHKPHVLFRDHKCTGWVS